MNPSALIIGWRNPWSPFIRALIWLEAIELPRDREEASKTLLIEACDAQLSIESRTEAIAAILDAFEPSKDFGSTLRNRSFGAGELHSEQSDFL